jgi:hypothetical protein
MKLAERARLPPAGIFGSNLLEVFTEFFGLLNPFFGIFPVNFVKTFHIKCQPAEAELFFDGFLEISE